MQYVIGIIGVICIIGGLMLSSSARTEIAMIPVISALVSGVIFLGFAVLIDSVQKMQKSVDRILNNVRKMAGTEDPTQSQQFKTSPANLDS